MENVMNVINLISTNWDVIMMAAAGIISGIITIASIVVKITPTESDNEALVKFVKFFEKFSLNTKSIEKK